MGHDFYKLDEAAKLLGCEINDLLKWGAAGKIDLCIWYIRTLKDRKITPGKYNVMEASLKATRPWTSWVKADELLPLRKEDLMQLYIADRSYDGQPGNVEILALEWPPHGQVIVSPTITLTPHDLLLTRESFDAAKKELLKNPTGSTVPYFNEEAVPPSTTPFYTGEILIGWKAIAAHLKVSVASAKRYAKGQPWPKPGPTGKPTTKTTELDNYLLSVSKKKKKRV